MHDLASLGNDSADRLDALLRGISNKSATSTGTTNEKAADSAANSLTSMVERKSPSAQLQAVAACRKTPRSLNQLGLTPVRFRSSLLHAMATGMLGCMWG